MTAFLVQLIFVPRGWLSGILSGAMFAGALTAGLLGIVLLPMSVLGIRLYGLGLLGLYPFAVSARSISVRRERRSPIGLSPDSGWRSQFRYSSCLRRTPNSTG
jgi:hypothetical protein